MIIDYHTHFFQPEHLGGPLLGQMEAAGYSRFRPMSFGDYDNAMSVVDRAIVFGLTARAMNVKTPNQLVADLVAQRPEKYIGFMALDPTDPGALEEMDHCADHLRLQGIKLYPTMQWCDVSDSRFHPFFARAQGRGLPIMFHFGASPFPRSKLRFSQPLLLDEVAIAFPELRMVIAHLGHPWQRDAIVLLRKHRHVFGDVSGLWHRPWEGYNTMISCQEWGVTRKLLFGSDYPLWTPVQAMEGLRRLNDAAALTKLPGVSQYAVEEIIQRNVLDLLGIGS